ncbi:hypothetical protein M5K25_025601 [Dendrobium thyrsiflorum]|uniref:Uncharacterized protein n=1 Tax=Dendrobium thyrsiflorum TaxID=117978 RepID=A0ABD0U9I3_DENTH
MSPWSSYTIPKSCSGSAIHGSMHCFGPCEVSASRGKTPQGSGSEQRKGKVLDSRLSSQDSKFGASRWAGRLSARPGEFGSELGRWGFLWNSEDKDKARSVPESYFAVLVKILSLRTEDGGKGKNKLCLDILPPKCIRIFFQQLCMDADCVNIRLDR